MFLFYRQGYTFPGWGWWEALVLLGVFTFLQGFASTILAPNLNTIVQQVQQGTLDFVLLKPVSSQFWLSSRTLSLWGVPDVILGGFLILYSGNHLHLSWTHYLLGVLPLGCACSILYSLWFILGSTSVWFVKIYNVTEVLRGLVEAGRYPISAYPVAYRMFFTFVVPVAFLTTVPAATVLDSQGVGVWLGGAVGLSLALWQVTHRFWQFALGFYTSASS